MGKLNISLKQSNLKVPGKSELLLYSALGILSIVGLIFSPFIIFGSIGYAIFWSVQFGFFAGGLILFLYAHHRFSYRKIEDFYKDCGMFVSHYFSLFKPLSSLNGIIGSVASFFKNSDSRYSEFGYIKSELLNCYRVAPLFHFIINYIGSFVVPLLGSLLWLWDSSPRKYEVKRYATTKNSDELSRVNSTEKWFFINGIGSNFDTAHFQARGLSEVFQRNIEMIYTPSYGMLYDVGLGIGSRTFEVSVNTTHLVESTIKNTLNDNNIRKIVIIAHSKGSVIAVNALRRLIADGKPEERQKIESRVELYCFGNLATTFPTMEKGPVYEIFNNNQDPITKLSTEVQLEEFVSGSLTSKLLNGNGDNRKPIVFVNTDPYKKGHLFGQNYMIDWINGYFTNVADHSGVQDSSRLFNYYQKVRA